MNHKAATRDRSRKRKAILAGGTVLGLGAAATLAAWTDSVWVIGAFSAGSFNVQGNITLSPDTGWTEYDTTETSAPLDFTVAAQAMTPGQSVYAPLNLRVGNGDSEPGQYGAIIAVAEAPSGPAESNVANDAFFESLQISLYNVPPTSCNETADLGTELGTFNNESLSHTAEGAGLLSLNRDGTPNGLCFKITLHPGATTSIQGGETGPLSWRLNAESVE